MQNERLVIGIGDILTRPKALGFVQHTGVALGPNAIFENTPGKGERLSSLQEFAAGKPIQVRRTGADPSAVMDRCRRALANPKKYDIFSRNCEHSAFEVISGLAKSPQLWFILGLFAAAGFVFCLASSRR